MAFGRTGQNVGRSIVGHADNSLPGRSGANAGSGPILQKAIVLDVVYDTEALTDEYLERLKATVNNYELVDVLPVNSIIARIISNSGGIIGQQDTILFPLISSHFMLPVQVGEIVNVMYEDMFNLGTKVGYWISRVHGDRAVEDVNYTHLDRRFDPLNNLGNYSTEQKANLDGAPEPGFPNGAGSSTNTIDGGNSDPYLDIINRSMAGKFLMMEPVPRWKKRPNELVIQGSNNSLLVLGSDRFNTVSGSITGDNPTSQAGALYASVGRGRFMPPSGSDNELAGSPRVTRNSRGHYETDKAPWRNKGENGGRGKDKPYEGEFDFTNDATTFILSQQTKGDENFGILNLPFADATLPIAQPTNDQNSGSPNRAYGIIKSDHIRLIARKDNANGINGSMLFVREGSEEDKDLSYIFMNEHGINIDSGKKIYLGAAAHQNPEDGTPDFNDDNGPYEPYILWSKYRDTVDSLQKQINELRTEHQTSIKTFRDGVVNILNGIQMSLEAGNISVPYGPNPGVKAASAAIAATIQTIQAPVDQPLTKITSNHNSEQDNNNKNNVSKKNHSQKIYGSKGE